MAAVNQARGKCRLAYRREGNGGKDLAVLLREKRSRPSVNELYPSWDLKHNLRGELDLSRCIGSRTDDASGR